MTLTAREPSLGEASSPTFDAGRKLGEQEKALLWQWLQADPGCPSRETAGEAGPSAAGGVGEPAPPQSVAGPMAAQPG